jgi:hypothetical protein
VNDGDQRRFPRPDRFARSRSGLSRLAECRRGVDPDHTSAPVGRDKWFYRNTCISARLCRQVAIGRRTKTSMTRVDWQYNLAHGEAAQRGSFVDSPGRKP